MGTVNRKPVAKKSAKKKSAKFLKEAQLVEMAGELGELSGSIGQRVTDYMEAVAEIGDDDRVTQTVMEIADMFAHVKKWTSDAIKAFEDKAKDHRVAKGVFELGRFAITFPETVRRSPSWKQEAINVARKLAEVQEEDFDADVYTKRVTKAATVSTSVKVQLVKSEG